MIAVTCTTIAVWIKTLPKNCFAILTDGERFKYVYFQTEWLKSHGVSPHQIYILHDNTKYRKKVPDFLNQYHYETSFEHTSLAGLYERLFKMVFVDHKCTTSVILEDDIFLGEDALDYFEWGRQLMELNDNILSISGSHDNADEHFTLNPNVFVKAEQLLGLGWMTHAKFYDKYLSELSDPWDKNLNDLMNRNKLVSVFPHLPRSVHVPWKEGRNGDLVSLQLSTENYKSTWPAPHVFLEYSYSYVDWLKSNVKVKERVNVKNVKTDIKVKWPYSYLAKRPFGQSDGLVIYPSADGYVDIVYV